VAVVAAILLFSIGSAIHSAGWTQGFTTGLLAGGAEGASLTPYLAYRTGHGFHAWGIGSFFGMIFRFGFLLLFFALIAKFFGFWRWHRFGYHGPWWHHHGEHYQGYSQPEQNDRPSSETGQPSERKPQNTSLTYV
jgi:hypothetical protein